MSKKYSIVTIGILFVVIVGMYLVRNVRSTSLYQEGTLEVFANCIRESGATFYGAFWCPHCQEQKKEFGDAKDLLPYVECSTPDGRGQTKVCEDAQITGYPTWVFGDGGRESGALPFDLLAEKTGCAAPVLNADAPQE